jgi:phytoene desaturase
MAETAAIGGARPAHAVVIGSGFGGLAAAVRLGARGYRVTVLERLASAGGRAAVFHQDGFTFDAGPTIVTAPQLFEELWTLCGRRMVDDVELRALTPFYQVRFDDGSSIDWSGDAAAMRAMVERLSPGDVAGYERVMAFSERVYRVAFEQLGHVAFNSWPDMVRRLPSLLRLRAWRSLHAVVASEVRDPRLRFLLSFHPLFVGGNPFSTSAIYGLILHLERIGGVHFAMGGTGALVRGLVRLIESQGGTLRYNAQVSSVLLRDRTAIGVELSSGERVAADVVVSNADTAWTYRNLLPAALRRRWSDRALRRARYSMGLFVWYFGTARQYPDVAHHTILVGPRYRGLLRDIFDRKLLADDFSLYLHRPTATDASLAPPGCDAFYVLSPVPHLAPGVDWTARAEQYRRSIETHLAATLLPNLRQNVVTSRVMTPLDFQQQLLAWQGSAFGMEPLLRQSAWFRPHNRAEDFERFYLVGAGTHPGAGLPGVLSTARVLDAVVPHGASYDPAHRS